MSFDRWPYIATSPHNLFYKINDISVRGWRAKTNMIRPAGARID
jgi:hypothetical protein